MFVSEATSSDGAEIETSRQLDQQSRGGGSTRQRPGQGSVTHLTTGSPRPGWRMRLCTDRVG